MSAMRTAMLADLRLNSGRFGATLALCGVCLIMAATLTETLAAALPIWAALAWYRYGRADTVERAELWASLGLSRADRVRGRIALIVAEMVLLILTSALSLALAAGLFDRSTVEPGPTFTISGPPGLSWGIVLLVGSLQTALVLLLTAIGVGGPCTSRRPGHGMAVMSIAVYLGAGLFSAIVTGLPLGLLSRDDEPLGYLAVAGGLAVIIALLALVLRKRMRGWIGLLDSGCPTPQKAAA